MKPRSSVLTLLVWILALGGCASPARHVILTEPQPLASDLGMLLQQHPLTPGENIRSVPLAQTEQMSVHLVQIRQGETPHVHSTHDLAVTMMRGDGVLHVGGTEQRMHAGDVAVVPRNTPHFFVNEGSEPAVAFVTFAPPYDGKDQLPVE